MYKTELFCMTTMIDLIVHPRVRHLDMDKLPKILRTHITSRLHVSLQQLLINKSFNSVFNLKFVCYNHSQSDLALQYFLLICFN